jgi:signal transduction histidine kinase
MVFTITHLPGCSDFLPSSKSGSKGTILIVDDSPDDLQVLSSLLESSDYHIREMLRGKMAVQVSQINPPDLILLDVCLSNSDSDINGYEVCRSLKASPATQDIPIIFLSGFADVSTKVKALEAGGADYITKPFEIDDLLVRIAHQLQLSRVHRQLRQRNLELEHQILDQTNQLQIALTFEAVLKRITDRVRDSLDETQILKAVVQELMVHLGIHGCDTALYDLTTQTSKICHESVHASIQPAAGILVQMSDFADVYEQLLQGEYALFCPALPQPSKVRGSHMRLSILACPLINEQGVFGDLRVFKDRKDTFSELEIRLVQQVANQCAIALRQAHLYQSAQRQVQELEHLNRLKDDFLSTVSHELRTPISNIKLAAQMLEIILRPMGVMDDESNRVARYFQIVHDECQRETDLVSNLLDLTRIDAGTEPIHTTPINPALWVAHIAESFTARIQANQQELQVNIAVNLPMLVTDLSYLERILAELLSNACKYTPPKERIYVSVQMAKQPSQKPVMPQKPTKKTASQTNKRGKLVQPLSLIDQESAANLTDTLKIAITNTGVEIPAAEQERIFDKFYRIPNSDPWKHGGTGLGLALVKKLVDRLGGQISVESQVNQTTFVLSLPIICVQQDESSL